MRVLRRVRMLINLYSEEIVTTKEIISEDQVPTEIRKKVIKAKEKEQ